jgi:hypothetical protein
MRWQELESDRLAQSQIVSAIYLTHGATSHQGDNTVPLRDNVTGLKAGRLRPVVIRARGFSLRGGLGGPGSSDVEKNAAIRARISRGWNYGRADGTAHVSGLL